MTPLSLPLPCDGRGAGRPVDSRALADVLGEFAATVAREFTLEDILEQLALGATRVLSVDGAGVSSPDPSGTLLRSVFATQGTARDLESLQEALQSGPCHDAFAHEQAINLADVVAEGAWPAYQARARELGVGAVAAIPLVARGTVWGVLDVYRAEALPLSTDELAAATTLANLATSYLVVAHDRDAARRAQETLSERAMHDTLTGLPVRWVFLDHLDRALERIERQPGCLAVLFADLDGLKYVNDHYGHEAGDRLLLTGAERMRAALRPDDVLARIGGDEFVVLLEDIGDADAATQVARRIQESLSRSLGPHGPAIFPSASIGIAMAEDHTVPTATLVAHADSAMYAAKRQGRGGIALFDEVGYHQARAMVAAQEELTPELRTALAEGQLEVHYQPIVDTGLAPAFPVRLPPGGLHAVEALVRWRHPTRGLLTAAEFVSTAERSGLLPDIGTFVLRTACLDLARWQARYGGLAPQSLYVNLAPTELLEPTLIGRVLTSLTDAGLGPERLVVEVTETGLLDPHRGALDALASLRDLGCGLAIDDFGAGYSSLSRVIAMPGATIKIDRSFVRDIADDPDATAVVSAVQTLGKSLGRAVVAEGVEDARSAQALRALGIRFLQGFHLGRPQPSSELEELLALGGRGPHATGSPG